MAEITVVVTRQSDGWYLASARHKRFGGATEAPEYGMLHERVGEFLRAVLSDGFGAEIGLPEKVGARLQYEETLFAHAGAESVRIVGDKEGDGYGVHMRKPFRLDIHRGTVEELRDAVREEMRQRNYHTRNVVLALEELLSAEALHTGTPKPHSTQSGTQKHAGYPH